MANEKQYVEVINDGIGDRYVYDGEARDSIDALSAAIGFVNAFVDLGLPSGTLWATRNVGAAKETDYGNYYTYGHGATPYDPTDTIVSPESGNTLDAEHDTASAALGLPCHMPTYAQINELIANTDYSWQTNFNGSGVNGGKFTSKVDATKYIFIPTAGCYNYGASSVSQAGSMFWLYSSEVSDDEYREPWGMSGYSAEITPQGALTGGMSVRAVIDETLLNMLNAKADATDVADALALKADAADLPTFATTATCEDIVDELT